MPILITCVSIQYKSIANPRPIWCQSNVIPKPMGLSSPHPWGVNSLPIHCNSMSIKKPILFQSKPNRTPITHIFGTNPLTSYTNLLPIHCQSRANPSPIWCQSWVNPLPIQCQSRADHSGTISLPIICQSSDIPVQIFCQPITKCSTTDPLQYNINQMPTWRQIEVVNRGGRQ